MKFWPRKRSKRILMVEDNVHNHDLFRAVFADAGFEVLICRSAEDDFLGEVKAFAPDIISMDLMIRKYGLPEELDGFQAIELLRTDDQTRAIPVIIMTNFYSDEKVERAKELGVVDYINLPGHELKKLPQHFLSYLKNPKKFVPMQIVLRTI